MKKVFTSLALLLVAGTVSAQNFSGGLRAGMNCENALDNQLESHGHMTTFQKEVFARYQGKSKWAFELSVGHEQYKNSSLSHQFFTIDNFSGEGIGGPVWETMGLNLSVVKVTLKAEYEMSCAQSDHCPLMSRFKNYMGIIAGPSFVRQEQNRTITPERGAPSTYTTHDNSVALWAGLSNTLQFFLTKQLYISGNMNYQVNVTDGTLYSSMIAGPTAGYTDPNSRFSATLGIGYNF